jgi:lysophospholipase L1-like esterase
LSFSGLSAGADRSSAAPARFEDARRALLCAAAWPLLPLLYLQGRRLRARTPRLPEASGPCTGRGEGAAPPIRLLVLGESTAAGVGAPSHREALAGSVAVALRARTGRAVEWRALGRSGATARVVREELLPMLPPEPWDAVVIALGVNDTLRLRGPRRWRRDLERLLRALPGAPVVVLASVPPMHRFPALPMPLRAVVGARARRLDREAARFPRRFPHVSHSELQVDEGPDWRDFFCADGFHPSVAGYTRWGEALAATVAAQLPGES